MKQFHIWTSQCQNVFDLMKVVLMKSTVLLDLDPNKQNMLFTDASSVDKCYQLNEQIIKADIFEKHLLNPKYIKIVVLKHLDVFPKVMVMFCMLMFYRH